MIDQPNPSKDDQPSSGTDESAQDQRKPLQIKIGSQRQAPSTTPSTEAPPADQTREGSEPSSPAADDLRPTAEAPAELLAESPSPAADEDVTDEYLTATPVPRMSQDLMQEVDEALGGLSLEELMGTSGSAAGEKTQEIELDQRRSATVIKTDRESVFFSLGGQNEGVASLKQFVDQVPEPGAVLEVVPTRFVPDENLYELVVPGGSVDVQDWSDLSEGVVVEAKITGHNKGGLECEVNHIRGFIPASQVSLYRVEDFESYVGQSLQCVVAESNPDRRNLVLSHRAVLEREKQEAREQLLESLEVGQEREGVVRRIQDFGAFVDIGGIDGLVHISQLSWDRIAHPSEVVEEGQTIRVRVEKIDPATGKIGLSYRDILDHPWTDADAKYPVGAILDGTVTKIMPFGAFVRLAAGVEGLVHISELAHHRVQRVTSVVQEGKPVRVKILAVDPQAQKMSLSIKAVDAVAPPEASEEDSPDEPIAESPLTRRRSRSLKGGLNRDSGGDQFGLNW